MQVNKYSGDSITVKTPAELAAIIGMLGGDISIDIERDMPMLDIVGDDDGINLIAPDRVDMDFIGDALTIYAGKTVFFNGDICKFDGI